ncbi:hypothetical protein A2627_05260 [Candidatus Woesebacteria bacterium RIFCSPHIGHO2_01_FULL_39_28]|uniref:HEPN domain-containing protein n=1 Tax=Candidatus Woesebacteria bacterium RIFCSPHIGHO2_01_FULL_39_28 TaxID=1802496 RepID=A0A1F7Y8Y7_9BACT|nr:MAG: hypothetical protein A2627_05260 [Candidatus Woesebacteria bacterium RIFCSPHIGHO2_01_FULL_39_28]
MTNIEYWLTSSKDDFDTTEKLFASKKYNHSLFFVHLALEKILKAIIVSKTNKPALPIHDLVRLAESVILKLSEEEKIQLAEISTFNVAARYDDYKLQFYKKATLDYATKWIEIAKKLYSRFEKLI